MGNGEEMKPTWLPVTNQVKEGRSGHDRQQTAASVEGERDNMAGSVMNILHKDDNVIKCYNWYCSKIKIMFLIN